MKYLINTYLHYRNIKIRSKKDLLKKVEHDWPQGYLVQKIDFLNFHLISQTFDSLNSSYEREGFESSGMKYIAHIFTFNELKNDV